MLHGLRHVLTPGDPAYAALKTGAVAAVFAAQYAARKRSREQHHAEADQTPASQDDVRRSPHPRSKKKKRRRRR